MGTIHLAVVDITKRFKSLGYFSGRKTSLSNTEITDIIKKHYPEIYAEFGNITLKNLIRVMDKIGISYRTEDKEIKVNPDTRQKIPFNERKLLRLLKKSGFVAKEVKVLSQEILRNVLKEHFNDMYTNNPFWNICDAAEIRKCLEDSLNPYKPKKKVKPKVYKVNDIDVTSKEFLNTWEWKTLRYEVLLEQGSKCQCCNATKSSGAIMCVDHIKPRRTHPELALDKNNLQVLCNDCNMGKGNWDDTDHRSK